MSKFIFADNAQTTLASAMGTSTTTLVMATGSGTEFPSPGAGQMFSITLQDAATGLIKEVMYCTNRVNDTCTVVRAQEGFTALNWNVGDVVSNYWTAGQAAALAQFTDVQQQFGNSAQDTSSGGSAANAGIITLTPAPTAYSQILFSPIRILKNGTANTGAYTLNVNGIGPIPVVFPNGAALTTGALGANSMFEVAYDGTRFQLISYPSSVGLGSPVPNTIYITSTGAWNFTVPTGISRIRLTLVGAGGGGAGCSGNYTGGGGGSGGTAIYVANIASGTAITGAIGVGGTGGAAGNNDGNNGGNTTGIIGALTITAGGGQGGINGGNTDVSGGAGGSSSGGSLNMAGGQGTNGQPNLLGQTSGNTVWGGNGAAGFMGMGQGRTAEGGTPDNYATSFGAGGGSAYATGAGGNGFQGLVIIEY